MIFVSMNSYDLLSRTARYQIREASSPCRSISSTPSRSVQPSTGSGFSESIDDDRPPSRRAGDDAIRNILPPLSDSRPYARESRSASVHQNSGRGASVEFPLPGTNDDFTRLPGIADLPTPSPFVVTTACDDHSGDEEEESSAATLADRYRRDRMPPPYDSSDDMDDDFHRWVESRARLMGIPTSHRRSRRRAAPSRIEIAERPAIENDYAKLLMPHATFFIERENSMISVKFDPPM